MPGRAPSACSLGKRAVSCAHCSLSPPRPLSLLETHEFAAPIRPIARPTPPRGAVRRMNDQRTQSPAPVLCASSRVSAGAGSRAHLEVFRRGIRSSRRLGPEFSERLEPLFLSKARAGSASPGETTQSGGGVMMPQAPSTVHDTPDARRVAKQTRRRHPRGHALGLGRATQGAHGATLSTVRRCRRSWVMWGDKRHNHNRSVGRSSVSPGRRIGSGQKIR